jgi:hypothetical protein
VTANAKVSKVTADRIVLEFRVERDGIVAMLGSAVVPLPAQPKA